MLALVEYYCIDGTAARESGRERLSQATSAHSPGERKESESICKTAGFAPEVQDGYIDFLVLQYLAILRPLKKLLPLARNTREGVVEHT